MFNLSIPRLGKLSLGLKGFSTSIGILIASQFVLPVAAAASVSTVLGDVQGDLAVGITSKTSVNGFYEAPVNRVWELSAEQVKVDQGGWVYEADLNQQFSYGAGYEYGGNYSAYGKLELLELPILAPVAGLTVGDVAVTITGRYQTTGNGGFWLNPSAGYLQSDGYFSGIGDFTYSTTLSKLAANPMAPKVLLNWSALFPYGATPGGGAQTSTVGIELLTLTLSQSVSAVPEPASVWLGALGVVGVGGAVRRSGHRRA